MKSSIKTATKQAISPISKVAPPLNRQFGQPNGNPRHNGAWKKEDTPRHKLEQMMKMTGKELNDIIMDEDAPAFQQKLAKAIQNEGWSGIERMINQVYGQPKESVDHTSDGETIRSIEVRFIDGSGGS